MRDAIDPKVGFELVPFQDISDAGSRGNGERWRVAQQVALAAIVSKGDGFGEDIDAGEPPACNGINWFTDVSDAHRQLRGKGLEHGNDGRVIGRQAYLIRATENDREQFNVSPGDILGVGRLVCRVLDAGSAVTQRVWWGRMRGLDIAEGAQMQVWTAPQFGLDVQKMVTEEAIRRLARRASEHTVGGVPLGSPWVVGVPGSAKYEAMRLGLDAAQAETGGVVANAEGKFALLGNEARTLGVMALLPVVSASSDYSTARRGWAPGI